MIEKLTDVLHDWLRTFVLWFCLALFQWINSTPERQAAFIRYERERRYNRVLKKAALEWIEDHDEFIAFIAESRDLTEIFLSSNPERKKTPPRVS